MLKKLFGFGRRAAPHAVALDSSAQPDVRLAAVQTLDSASETDGQALQTLAASGEAPLSLRSAALERLTSASAITPLLTDAAVADLAAARLLQVLPADALANELARQPRLAYAAMANSQLDETLQQHAFDTLATDADACVAIATGAALPRWRQHAVEQLQGDEHLATVVRATRASDKRIHRAARERLDELRACIAQDTTLAGELDELATRMQTLASRTPDTLQRREAEHVQARWQAVTTDRQANIAAGQAFRWQPADTAAAQSRFETAVEQLNAQAAAEQAAAAQAKPAASAENGAAPEASDRPEEASDRPEDAEGDPQAAESVADAARSLASLRRSLEAGEFDPVRDMAAINTALSLERSRFDAAHADAGADAAATAAAFAADAALIETAVTAAASLRALTDLPVLETVAPPADEPLELARYTQLWQARADSRKQRRQLERQLAGLQWPAALPAPAALLEWRNHLHAMDAFEATCEAHAAHLDTLLDTQQQHIAQHVEAGELSAALDARSRGRDLLRALPRDRQKQRQGEFDLLAGRVEELRDWREFATHPKREQLCEAMEASAERPAEPSEQASRVRDLRSEWNALGAPRNPADHKLRERFDAAAERAFEPCRAWFEQQAAEREANGAARLQIVEQLEAFLETVDWATVNWKSIEAILRTARREWRDFQPAPRKGAQAVGKRFGAATATLDERLEAEYARNLRALETIVAAAEAESAADTDAGARIETAKTLQQRWNAVGVTPRRKQQALWKRFRAACDAVFAARDAQRSAERDVRRANADAATALCDALQAHLDSTAPSQLTAGQLGEFEQRFDAVQAEMQAAEPPDEPDPRGNAPRRRPRERADSRSNARFADLVREFRSRLGDQQRQHRLHAARELLQASTTLGNSERNPTPPTDAPEPLPASQRRALGARLTALQAGTPLPAEPEAALDLAIEAEIIAGEESAPEDAERRMRVQVARLSRGLQGGDDDSMSVVIDLIERWCQQPSPPETVEQRFAAAIAIAIDDVDR